MAIDTIINESFESIPLGHYDTTDVLNSFGGWTRGSGQLNPIYWSGLARWHPPSPHSDSNLWVVDSFSNKFLFGRYLEDEYEHIGSDSDTTGSGWGFCVDPGNEIIDSLFIGLTFNAFIYPGMSPSISGKWLVGLYGIDGRTGGNGCPAEWVGWDGFSWRLQWYNIGDELVLAFYAYYVNMPCSDCPTTPCYGEMIVWHDPDDYNSNYTFPEGEWTNITIMLSMNSLGSADGIAMGWVNGRLAVQKTGINFRRSPIKVIPDLTWFYGGGSSVFDCKNDSHKRLDDIILFGGIENLPGAPAYGETADTTWVFNPTNWNTITGQPIFGE